MPLLRVKKGVQQGALYPVFSTQQPTVIGRDPEAEVSIPDGRASRRHSSLQLTRGRWLLQDLRSSNGTLVEGKRISTIEIGADVSFQVGTTVFSFHPREIAPPPAELHGVQALQSLREEAGVFVCRGHQVAMDREVRLDWLHPRRSLGAESAARLQKAFDEARRLQNPDFLTFLHAQAEAGLHAQAEAGLHAQAGGEGTFALFRESGLSDLEEKWSEVQRLPLRPRLEVFWSIVEMNLERATWESLRFPIGLAHIAVELKGDGTIEVRMPGLDLGPILAQATGNLCHIAAYAPYLPPEHQVAEGDPGKAHPPLSGAMYNLGALGYHLLTGQPPMGEGDVETILERHRALRPAPASLLVPSLPNELSAILERLLEKDPAQRPRGRKEILDAIAKGLASCAPTAPPPGEMAPAPSSPRSSPRPQQPAARKPALEAPAPGAARSQRHPVAGQNPPAETASPPPKPDPPPARQSPPPARQSPAPPRRDKTPAGLIYLPLWMVVWVSLFFAAVYLSKELFVMLES